MVNWTPQQFTNMCILSGCDYLSSIPSVGLKTAYKYIKKWNTPERAIRQARFDGLKVPLNYEKDFERARATFLYQRVYDPRSRQITTLSPLNSILSISGSLENSCALSTQPLAPLTSPTTLKDGDSLDSFEWIGRNLEPKIAMGIGEGFLNPFSHQPNLEGSGSDPDGLCPHQVQRYLKGSGPIPSIQRETSNGASPFLIVKTKILLSNSETSFSFHRISKQIKLFRLFYLL